MSDRKSSQSHRSTRSRSHHLTTKSQGHRPASRNSSPRSSPLSPGSDSSSNSKTSKKSFRAKAAERALLRTKLLKASQNRCVYCGTSLTMATLTMDHVYPQLFGGPDLYENLVSACGPCNVDKAHMHPDAWFQSRPITAAGFLLLARHVSPQYLVLAAEILAAYESPYAEGPILRPPLKLRFMAAKLRPFMEQALLASPEFAKAA